MSDIVKGALPGAELPLHIAHAVGREPGEQSDETHTAHGQRGLVVVHTSLDEEAETVVGTDQFGSQHAGPADGQAYLKPGEDGGKSCGKAGVQNLFTAATAEYIANILTEVNRVKIERLLRETTPPQQNSNKPEGAAE